MSPIARGPTPIVAAGPLSAQTPTTMSHCDETGTLLPRLLLVAGTVVLAPGVAAASTGGATGPVLLLLLLVAPVGIVLAALTWPLLPEWLRRGPRHLTGYRRVDRVKAWLELAAFYTVVLAALVLWAFHWFE